MLKPINGCVLVELAEELQHIKTPDKQYSTKTRGIVRSIAQVSATNIGGSFEGMETFPTEIEYNIIHDYLINKMVFFEDFKDGTQVEQDGKKYAFIKFEDIRGYDE